MYRGKRFFTLVLGVVLLLGACGKPQDGPEFPEAIEVTMECPIATIAPTANPVVTPESEMTVAPTREVLPEVIATEVPKEPTLTPEPTETPIPTVTPMPIPATVGPDGALVDSELCKVQAVSLEKEEYYYVLRLSIENRTGEALKFYIGDVYVNRMNCFSWDCEVPAGEIIEEAITLYNVEKYAGVTELSDITELYMPLEIYGENEAWLDIFERSREGYWPEPIFQQMIYYYPQGVDGYIPFKYERQADDIVVVDNEELTLLVTGDVYEETGGYVIKLFLENHTNKSVRYEMEELALNGFLCEPFYELKCDLYPETGTYGAIEYFGYWKDETEGDAVTEISFSLSATSLDYDYWYSEDFTVYLRGEESVKEYVYVPGERDVVIYDGPEALLAMTDIELSEENGKMICTATAYVENKTGETLYAKCENAEEIVARVGEYLPNEWNDYVIAGKKRKVQLVLYDCLESWEEKGKWFVTLPLEMSLSVDGSYKTDTFFDETITLLISGEGIGIASDD